MSNEDQKTTLCISSVSLFVWQTAPRQHEAGIEKKNFDFFILNLRKKEIWKDGKSD